MGTLGKPTNVSTVRGAGINRGPACGRAVTVSGGVVVIVGCGGCGTVLTVNGTAALAGVPNRARGSGAGTLTGTLSGLLLPDDASLKVRGGGSTAGAGGMGGAAGVTTGGGTTGSGAGGP